MANDYYPKIKHIAEDILKNKKQCVAHRIDHVERVLANAKAIAKSYKAIDMEMLKISILLHDISHPFNRKSEHVKLSVKAAEKILNQAGYPKDKTKKVLLIISEHSTENVKKGPTSLESKILFDADKIDGLGAIGLARVFSFCGQNRKPPIEAASWYKRKIKIAVSHMQTVEGKKMAMKKLRYVNVFLKTLKEENAI